LPLNVFDFATPLFVIAFLALSKSGFKFFFSHIVFPHGLRADGERFSGIATIDDALFRKRFECLPETCVHRRLCSDISKSFSFPQNSSGTSTVLFGFVSLE
jgi:hypothetical protein